MIKKTVTWRKLHEALPNHDEWCLVVVNDFVLPATWCNTNNKFFGISKTVYDTGIWISMEELKP